jgi:hypothetical protein
MAFAIQPQVIQWGPVGAKMLFGSATPTLASEGPYAVGDIIVNTAPTAGGTFAWVCTTAGTGAVAVFKAIAVAA